MIGIAIIAAFTILLSTIILFSRFVDRNIEADLERTKYLIINEIKLMKTQAKFAALYSANDNTIINALISRNQEELIQRASELYENYELTVLAITDERGIVQARGQFPHIYGDDLSSRTVTRTALEGRHETFVERGPIIPLAIVSGIPVYDAYGTLIGTISAGFRMDTDSFVDNLQNLSGCEISVFSLDGRRITTTLLDKEGNRAVSAKAPADIIDTVMTGKTVTGQFRLFGQEMLGKYMPLYATSGEIIGMFFAGRFLTARTDMIWSYVATGLLILSLLFAANIPSILYVTGRIAAPINKSLDQLHYDVLTGIYNRRYFDENIDRVLRSLARSGSALSLMMVDIDSFKKFNDTYGHRKGDECLRQVAEALAKSIIRPDDFVARYGGEEFVVVLPNTDEIGAHLIALRLLENVRNLNIPHKKNDAADYITVSIGVTSACVDHQQNSDDYVNRADQMLYESKSGGRNQYRFAPLRTAGALIDSYEPRNVYAGEYHNGYGTDSKTEKTMQEKRNAC